MERATRKAEHGRYYLTGDGIYGDRGFPARFYGDEIDRLAAYENTGVEPEDVITALNMARIACALHELNQYKELGDLDRLRELVEADKAGRCAVLPCKDWLDLVFGNQEVFWAVDDDYDDEKIREITVRNEERFIWFDGWKTVVFNGTDENGLDYEFSPEDVGKTVFTTREAAEAALAKEADHE